MAMHFLVGIVALIAGVGALPAPAANAAAASRTLTVRGAAPGEARIELTRKTIVAIDATLTSKQVAITGRGRAVGAVLERVGEGPRAVLAALNYNACGAKGCKPLTRSEFVTGAPATVPDEMGESRVTLPAGIYRVVLVADGGPVEVRLTLTGLARSTTLEPQGDPGVRFHRITDITRTALPAGFTYSGGRTYKPSSGAIVGFQELYRTSPGVAAVAGTCIIRGEAPPADAYVPRCPTGDPASDREEFITPVAGVDSDDVIFQGYGAVQLLENKQTSIGHYLVSAVPVEDTNVVQIEVPLNRPPRKAGDTAPRRTSDGDAEVGRSGGRRDGPRTPDAGSVAPPATPSGAALPATGGTFLLPLLGAGLIALSNRWRRRT